jgi:hypothetical protein
LRKSKRLIVVGIDMESIDWLIMLAIMLYGSVCFLIGMVIGWMGEE